MRPAIVTTCNCSPVASLPALRHRLALVRLDFHNHSRYFGWAMDQPARETIPVRDGEGFDLERVAGYLRGRLTGAGGPLRAEQFGGGKANLTYLLKFPDSEYVLRRPPMGPVAPSAHDMSREYRVLSKLWRAFPLAPRAYLFCDDPEVLGAPFLIMERRRGLVVRRELPPQYAEIPGAGRRLSEALVAVLADLHAVDFQKLGLGELGEPGGFLGRQVEGWTRRWKATRLGNSPEMDRAASWLERNLPETRSFSLVHNDFKLDNVMFDPDDPGRPVAVFDWDMCTLGDPLSDLGALLAYWSQPDDPPYLRHLRMMPNRGFATRAEITQLYAKGTGCSTGSIGFYHALGLFRVAVIVAQIFGRYKRGQTRDSRFARFGELVPGLAKAACDVAGV